MKNCTKRVMAWVLAAALLISCGISGLVLPATAAVGDVVFSEDFEGATVSSVIKNWTGKGEVVADPQNADNKVLKVTTAMTDQYSGGKFGLQVNKTYLYRFRAYGKSGVQVRFNASKGILNEGRKKVDTTGGWTEFVYIVKTTDQYNNFANDNYCIGITAPVGTYLDDFSLTEIEHDAKNLLVGGDFEAPAAYYPIAAWQGLSTLGEVIADPDDATNHIFHINKYGVGTEYYNGRTGIQANKAYTLSFRAKGKNLMLFLNSSKGVATNSGWNTVLDETGSEDWKDYKLTFTTGASVSDANYVLIIGGGSQQLGGAPDAYIDNVRLEVAYATAITMPEETLYLGAGASEQLTLTYEPVGSAVDSVSWKSDDETLVTVDENGKVTALDKQGTTTVTATAMVGGQSITATRTVTVVKKADSFAFADEAITLPVGGKKKALVVADPEGCDVGKLVYSSDNEAVATVDENGFITAVAAGTATIIVKNGDNAIFANEVSDTLTVTVENVAFFEDFEGATVSSVIKNWTDKGEVVADPQNADNKVLKVTTAMTDQYSGGKFGLQVNKTYLYRFRAYGTNGVQVRFNPGKGILNEGRKKVDTTGGWTEFVYIVKTTDQYNSFNNDGFCIGITAPVGTYLDDFSLTEIEHDAKNLLVGGDFEAPAAYYPIAAWQGLSTLGEVIVDPDDATNHIFHINKYGAGTEYYKGRTGIQANKAYTLSFRAKGKNLKLFLTSSKGIATNSGWNTVLDETGSEEWKDYKLTFTTAGSVDDGGYVLIIGGGSQQLGGAPDAYIDNVRLEVAAATAVTMPSEPLNLGVGASEQLTLTYEPVGATVDSVTWKSSDETVATVDANGKVTATDKGGEVTVTATVLANGETLTATRTIIVVKKADSFAFADEALNIPVGGKKPATVVAVPLGANLGNLIFTSSNEAVATVDAGGVITAVAVGTATITVKNADNAIFDTTITDTLTVTVEKMDFFEDFEGDSTHSAIINWTANGEVVTDPKNAANKVLKVTTAMSDKYSGGKFGLEPNKTYLYRFRAYGGNKVNARFNAGKGILNEGRKAVDTTAGWTEFVYILKTTDQYNNFLDDTYSIAITAPVGTYLDDFSLEEIDHDAKNTLVGGDFEAPAAYYPIAAWRELAKIGELAVDPDDATNHVFHINKYGTGNEYYNGRVGILPNSSYTLTFRAKGKNMKIYIALSNKGIASGSGWKTVLDGEGSDEWKTYSYTFTTASSVDDAGYVINFGGKTDNLAGTPDAYIDDVRLERAAATEISVGSSILYIGQGATEVLDVVTTPIGAVVDSLTFKSSDETLVTVDANGVITAAANKEGQATITVTATVKGQTLTATRTVAVVGDAESFEFEKEALHLAPASKAQAVVKAIPQGARVGNLIFASSNTAVATVDANGIITAVAAGKATITVKNADNAIFAGTVTDVIEVTVDEFGERINGGSFEDAATNDAQWTTNIIKDGVGAVAEDSADRENSVLKLPANKTALAVYGVALNPNKSYKLTFKARGASVKTLIAANETIAGNRGEVSTSLKTTEWTEVVHYFSTGTNPSATLLSFANGSTTVALELDNVSLVQLPDATGLALTPGGEVSMIPENKTMLKVTAVPNGAFAGDVTFSSSDSSVVAVDEAGNLTVMAESGSAVITASSVNQAGQTITTTLKVNVDAFANMINNGDFEQGKTNWAAMNSNLLKLDELIQEGIGRDGSTGVLIKNDTDVNLEFFYKLALPLTPGTTYKVSFDYKTFKSASSHPARIWSGTLNCGNVYSTNSNGEWKTVSKVFTTTTTMKLNKGYDLGMVFEPGPAEGMVIDNIRLELYDSGVPATSVEMTRKSIRLVPGRSTALAVSATPTEGDVNLLKWESSNENVATVEYGVVTGVGKGTATITATTRNGKVATATVTVSGGEALIKNGTFDIQGDKSWTTSGTAAIGSAEGVRKTAGAKLTAVGDAFSQAVKGLKPETNYTLSMRFSGKGNASVLLKNGTTELVKQSVKTATAWETKSFKFTTPAALEDTTAFELALASGDGPIYVDYVLLTEDATLIDMVVNDIYWIGANGPLEQDHQVKPGTELQFVVTVLNQGEDAIKAGMTFDVEIQVDAQKVQTLTFTADEDIETGGLAILVGEEIWKATEGDHTVSALANASLSILELDDTNNDAYQSSLRVSDTFLEIPELAEIAGFDELIFNDEFDSLHTVDVFGTGAAGYKWYVTRPYSNTKLDPDDYEIKDGIIIVKNKDSRFNYGMATIDENTGRGFSFNKGYLEFRLRIPSYDASKDGGPAIWSFPPDKITEVGGNYSLQWVEMDWMEYWGITKERPEGHWTISMHETIRAELPNGTGDSQNVLAQHSAANRHKRGLGDGEWHEIEFLWTDDLILAYMDGTEVFRIKYADGEFCDPYTFNTATEDGTGAFSYMNEQLLALILGGSIDNQMEVDYIRVWGGSSLGYVPPTTDKEEETPSFDMDAATFWANYCVDDFGEPIVPETLDEYSSLYVMQGAEIWSQLSAERKAEINELLKQNGQPTFEELLKAVEAYLNDDTYAKAFVFVELFLIGDDGLPITEVTENNYLQILESAVVFAQLDEATQLEVLALMADYGMPAYDTLVLEALAMAEELGAEIPDMELPDFSGDTDEAPDEESPETGEKTVTWPIVVMIACAAVLLLSHKRQALVQK